MGFGAGGIIIGAFGLGSDDLIHTVATSLVVFGAVVISVATEASDQATD